MKAVTWTMHHTTNGNSWSNTTGAISVNHAFHWWCGGYSPSLDLSSGRVFGFYMAGATGNWGLNAAWEGDWQLQSHVWSRKAGENVKVRELGVAKYDSGAASGNFSIKVSTDGTVEYYLDETLVYTSLTPAPGSFVWMAAGGTYGFDNTFTTATNDSAELISAYYTSFTSDAGGETPVTTGQLFPRGIN